jgi:hypothetical protein
MKQLFYVAALEALPQTLSEKCNILLRWIIFISILLVVLVPIFVSADCTVNGQTFPDGHPACASQETFSQSGTESGGLSYSLNNPLQFNSLEALIVGILNVLLVIAVPIIVFFIIFAGFSYVTAQGNPEKIKQASRSLTYAIIGGVLILGSVAIAEILKSVVESF